MQSAALFLLLVSTLPSVGCQGKAEKVKTMQAQYNAEYPAFADECLDETSDSARMLTGEKLTEEQMARLNAKKKERDARCKLEAGRLAEFQKQILAAQQ
jgi:hypothetical protein